MSGAVGGEESAQARSERMRQLESMVQQLMNENKTLLDRVHGLKPPAAGVDEEGKEEDDTLSLGDTEEGEEDVW